MIPTPLLACAAAASLIAAGTATGYALGNANVEPHTATVTEQVTAPPVTRTVKVTERVTQRASRSLIVRPAPSATPSRASSKPRSTPPLDLRNERLWDLIAACESSGRWSLNVGTYDGGFQFLPSTWRSWGGTDFAPYAWQATRAEQITVANRSGRTDPWLKPWPVCGRKAAAQLGVAFP
jgi:hypothetical protein